METDPIGAAPPDVNASMQPAPEGGFVPSRLRGRAAMGGPTREVHDAFRAFITAEDFPCVGARAAFNSGSYALAAYTELASSESTQELARDLREFTASALLKMSEYATFVAVFQSPEAATEAEFEELLWRQLQRLNEIDARDFPWDSSVRSDPADPQFSFSFGAQALYVIGLHPNSSRLARRFRWPALIFNPHEQFERLRADGKWKRMQQTIRQRDVQLQGSINPMLSDFGESSEARQYSGRVVEENWRAPFEAQNPASAGRCPFEH